MLRPTAFTAFLDPDAMVKWLPPHGFTGKVHQMDARVGGKYRMSFTNFGTGSSHSFGGEYFELVPGSGLQSAALIRSILVSDREGRNRQRHLRRHSVQPR